MRFDTRFLRVALTVVLLSVSINGVCSAETPTPANISWGIYTGDAGGQGVAIEGVEPNSPAAKAGLQTGDVLLSINGAAVRSAQDFRAVKNSLPLYTRLNLVIKRNGAMIERQIFLAGLVRLEVKELKSEFAIPGVPPPPSAVPSAIETLDLVNVLDQVILDPKSGKVAIIGHYDKDYNTGAIPYLDLLKTALVYSTPKLNLNPTPDTKKQILDVFSSPPPASFLQLLDVVQGHPDMERDRQVMISVISKALGLSPEEYVAWFNYAKLEENKGVHPPLLIRDIQIKGYRNLGYSEIARALELVFQNTPDAAAQALQVLGHGSEASTILARGGTGGEAKLGALTGSVYMAILEQAKLFSPESLVKLRIVFNAGNITWQEVVSMAQSIMPFVPKNGGPNLRDQAFNKMTLSAPAVQALYNIRPGFTEIECINLDNNSQLTRIMFEADYSLKSVDLLPELFFQIPGFQTGTELEVENRLFGKKDQHFEAVWLEPKNVAMTVSPERNVVAFTSTQMQRLSTDFNPYFNLPPNEHSRIYAALDTKFNNEYDTYAHIMPAFHKVREVAKVIALAKWALAEKVTLDLSGVAQEKWSMPDKIPQFWTIKQAYQQEADGTYLNHVSLKIEGGVSFNPKGNWTQMTPSTVSETKATDQLSLSAGLGHKAVQAAQGGNLEQARYLAELSAQAMNGSVSKLDLAKQNIVVPDVKSIPAAPANVQLQKEMLKKTYQQITTISQNSSGRAAADATLAQLNNLYDQVKSNPVAASDYLTKLQTGQLPLATATPVATGRIEAEPAPANRCVDANLGRQELTPERREYLSQRLKETRDHLRHIDEAMRRIAELNARDVKQMDELTGTISDAYQKAVERIADVVTDGLVSWPQGKQDAAYSEAKTSLEKALGNLNNEISRRIGLKTTALSAAEAKKVDGELQNLYAAQYRVKDLYARVNKSYDVGKGVDNGIRYTKGTSELAGEKDFIEQTRQSVLQTDGIMLDHPEVKKALEGLKIFKKARVDLVSDTWTFGQYMIDYGIDIYAGYKLWEPLVGQLNNNIDANRKALLELRTKTQQGQAEAQCLEGLMAR